MVARENLPSPANCVLKLTKECHKYCHYRGLNELRLVRTINPLILWRHSRPHGHQNGHIGMINLIPIMDVFFAFERFIRC